MLPAFFYALLKKGDVLNGSAWAIHCAGRKHRQLISQEGMFLRVGVLLGLTWYYNVYEKSKILFL